jgi:predicted O-methyltransferase YrrM
VKAASLARGAAARVRHARDRRALGGEVARFWARAERRARADDDAWGREAVTTPADVAILLRLAAGRHVVVELGTAIAWTTAALALADPARRVVSFDPVVHPQRDRYLALLPAEARARIALVQAPGERGPGDDVPGPVDLLFVDSSHERDATIAEYAAWRPALAPGAIVAFHDFGHPGFPGVAEAIHALGLEGRALGGLFVHWT